MEILTILLCLSCSSAVWAKSSYKLTEELKQQFLDAHAACRQKAKTEDGYSNLNVNLKWDDKLAAYAQERIYRMDTSQFSTAKHTTKAQLCSIQGLECKMAGENLAMGEGYQVPTAKAMEAFNGLGKLATDDWCSERKDYTPATNACTPGKACGHYTQVIWDTTETVGCAVRMDHDETASYQWIVQCNYGPAGNANGAKPYEAGRTAGDPFMFCSSEASTICDASGKFSGKATIPRSGVTKATASNGKECLSYDIAPNESGQKQKVVWCPEGFCQGTFTESSPGNWYRSTFNTFCGCPIIHPDCRDKCPAEAALNNLGSYQKEAVRADGAVPVMEMSAGAKCFITPMKPAEGSPVWKEWPSIKGSADFQGTTWQDYLKNAKYGYVQWDCPEKCKVDWLVTSTGRREEKLVTCADGSAACANCPAGATSTMYDYVML